MDLHRLRYFLVVVDEMHFGRAAQQLRIAQPALSQQVKRLETDLGVTLFDRRRRRIELTDAGRTLAEEGRRLLRQSQWTTEATRMAGRGEIGTIRVGMVSSALVAVLPALIREFRRQYPGARLQIEEMPLVLPHVEAIRDRRIDAGLLRHPPPHAPGVLVEPVRQEPLVAVLPEDHRLRNHDVIPLSALRDEPFVLWPRSSAPRLYDQLFSESGALRFVPDVVQEAQEVLTRLAMVAAGVGVSLLPASVAELSRPGVLYRDLEAPAPTTTLAVAWHRDDDSALLRSFLRVVRQTLGVGGA